MTRMALSVPGTFITDPRDRTPRGEHCAWRLPLNHAQDLRDVARGVEETNAGVCCRYLVDLMSGEGAAVDVDGDGYVHHLEAAEQFCERYGVWRHPAIAKWRDRVKRCRRALALLADAGEHKVIGILHVAHGPPDPSCRTPELVALGQEVAGLIRYTEVVEQRRREMFRHEALRRAGDHGAPVCDLERRRQLLAWTDRAVSSGDALRHALAPFGEPAVVEVPGENKAQHDSRREARDARRKAHDARRKAFLVEARVEATMMLSAAERAYHDAWLGCP